MGYHLSLALNKTNQMVIRLVVDGLFTYSFKIFITKLKITGCYSNNIRIITQIIPVEEFV